MLVYLLKTYKEGKESGMGGFFQGVVFGLIGAGVSVTDELRIFNNLIIGIKNTVLIFNHKFKMKDLETLELYKKL